MPRRYPIHRPTPTSTLFLLAALSALWLGSIVAAPAPSSAYRSGVERLRARDYTGAVEALQRAVQEDPRSTDGWLNLGIARAALQDWSGAIEAYRQLLEIEPRHARALNNLANVYFRQGLYDDAGKWYARALAVDPDYLLAAYHYGWVLRQQNRPEEAEKQFRHCLELKASGDRERRTQLDSLYYLGTLRFRAGDFEQSRAMMEQVLAAHQAHAEARYYLGMSYRQLGRIEEARQQLEIHRQLLQAARGAPLEQRPQP